MKQIEERCRRKPHNEGEESALLGKEYKYIFLICNLRVTPQEYSTTINFGKLGVKVQSRVQTFIENLRWEL